MKVVLEKDLIPGKLYSYRGHKSVFRFIAFVRHRNIITATKFEDPCPPVGEKKEHIWGYQYDDEWRPIFKFGK